MSLSNANRTEYGEEFSVETENAQCFFCHEELGETGVAGAGAWGFHKNCFETYDERTENRKVSQ